MQLAFAIAIATKPHRYSADRARPANDGKLRILSDLEGTRSLALAARRFDRIASFELAFVRSKGKSAEN